MWSGLRDFILVWVIRLEWQADRLGKGNHKFRTWIVVMKMNTIISASLLLLASMQLNSSMVFLVEQEYRNEAIFFHSKESKY